MSTYKLPDLHNFIFPENENFSINSDETLFTIFFNNDMNIETFADVEQYSKVWDKILGSFLILTGNETDAILIQAYSSKQAFFTVKLPLNSGLCFAGAIIDILTTYKKLVEIRKLKVDIQKLDLSEHLLDELEQEMMNIVDNTTAKTIERIINDSNIRFNNADEIFTESQYSLKMALSFIEKGGVVLFNKGNNAELNNLSDSISNLLAEIYK
ncbi:MAG: hypothetical protein WCK02_12075 [Bacteroidota bacterium]